MSVTDVNLNVKSLNDAVHSVASFSSVPFQGKASKLKIEFAGIVDWVG